MLKKENKCPNNSYVGTLFNGYLPPIVHVPPTPIWRASTSSEWMDGVPEWNRMSFLKFSKLHLVHWMSVIGLSCRYKKKWNLLQYFTYVNYSQAAPPSLVFCRRLTISSAANFQAEWSTFIMVSASRDISSKIAFHPGYNQTENLENSGPYPRK